MIYREDTTKQRVAAVVVAVIGVGLCIAASAGRDKGLYIFGVPALVTGVVLFIRFSLQNAAVEITDTHFIVGQDRCPLGEIDVDAIEWRIQGTQQVRFFRVMYVTEETHEIKSFEFRHPVWPQFDLIHGRPGRG